MGPTQRGRPLATQIGTSRREPKIGTCIQIDRKHASENGDMMTGIV